ncbi:MAG: DUF4846 domain-containing protein [Myxococcota bacterium]
MTLALIVVVISVPWPTAADSTPLRERFETPADTERAPADGFGEFLRALPIRAGRPSVRLHDGGLKARQDVHAAVVDVDVGTLDLQQCADAALRLWAEYLWASERRDGICFRFTSGDAARWSSFRRGERAVVDGNSVRWRRRAEPRSDYVGFRRYLDSVFRYAGTASLARDLRRVKQVTDVRVGDVLLQGGFPGHAVLVVDLAQNQAGQHFALLAQSYMPAQDIHVLRGPDGDSPWYPVQGGVVQTPEWRFNWDRDLYRFHHAMCDP